VTEGDPATFGAGVDLTGRAGLLLSSSARAEPRRIAGVTRDALPASPPSVHRFEAVLPRGARLTVSAGIPARYRHEPGVEFSVKVGPPGGAVTLLSRLLDPANRRADRQWVPLDVDLSRHAGQRVEILLETRGFGQGLGAADRAYWGNPLLTSSAAPSRPLVVVYLVDTLRADHLPLYGYPRNTAPELTRLARDGVVFDQAIAPSSWTKPSVASLFTSLLPRDHGCLQFYAPLDRSLVTLAEMLRPAGYVTGAVVANPILVSEAAAFGQGFSVFAAAREPLEAEGVVDDALRILDRSEGLPLLLYVHTMDPHAPYDAPTPFDRLFPASPRPSPSGAGAVDAGDAPGLDEVVREYDGEIAYGDREFGRLIRELERRGLYEDALVVFLADHGEELGERGTLGHGHSLFDELVRVPLVVKYPGGRYAGRRVARQVQMVDILPTVLAAAGVRVPDGLAGRPLEESVSGPRVERPAPLETKHREHVAYGARSELAKYVRTVEPADRESYIDLIEDPGERNGRSEPAVPGAAGLKRAAEDSTGQPAYAHRFLFEGEERYEVTLRTRGWFDGVEAGSLGQGERAEVSPDRREARLLLVPRSAEPRDVLVRTRPHGVALRLEGTRGGRPVRPSDLRVGGRGQAPDAGPLAVPEVEMVNDPFTPPPTGRPGISVWFVPGRRAEAPLIDPRLAEELRSLGYLQ
jgi:arylsulfatase A-like enzyme